MRRDDFENARELDKQMSELMLEAEVMLQNAKRLKEAGCCGVIEFGQALPTIRLTPEDLGIVAEIYYKRHNDIQRKIGELKTLFDIL